MEARHHLQEQQGTLIKAMFNMESYHTTSQVNYTSYQSILRCNEEDIG